MFIDIARFLLGKFVTLRIGHRALGIGHWAWGMGHWAWGIGHGAWGMEKTDFHPAL